MTRGGRTYPSPSERLASRLVVEGECLVWTGTRLPDGYGNIRAFGKKWGTHRLAWVLANGPIPDGLQVCHHCDNPPCVKLDHLFLGTNAQNMADRHAKGRTVIPVAGGFNLRKTHCPHGHPYDEANTKFRRGRRECRACLKARDANRIRIKVRHALG